MTRNEILVQSKLLNCERIAWRQRALTMQEAREHGAGWTAEDAAILCRMNLADRRGWDKYAMRGNDYRAHRNYRENLNA